MGVYMLVVANYLRHGSYGIRIERLLGCMYGVLIISHMMPACRVCHLTGPPEVPAKNGPEAQTKGI